tara:strand:+ start:3319 stop:4569 length:1251 start_codon:yes stop_codon:yes gene_type:complete
MTKGLKKTFQEFLSDAYKVHGDNSYKYEKDEYKNYSTPITIHCKKKGHDSFNKTPNEHINKKMGCPKCSLKKKYSDSFKNECKKLGINYWRALKRKQQGMSKEKVFYSDYVRGLKETKPISINQVIYPNLAEAHRQLKPLASLRTLKRWIVDEGMNPEEAFKKTPMPGFSNGIIYLVTNKTTQKKYVGQTIDILEERWKGHLEAANSKTNKNKLSLQTAIRKYGENDFSIEIIDKGSTLVDLEQKEIFWIKAHGTLAPEGYNLNKGGSSGGSHKKTCLIDNINFNSIKEASKYLSKKKNISIHAAKWRISKNKLNVKSPPKPGEGVSKNKSYKAWSRIKNSYTNPNAKKGYLLGIKLCDEWKIYANFCKDVGEPPSKSHVFCRLDKSKDYEPGNCAWLPISKAASMAAKYQKRDKD